MTAVVDKATVADTVTAGKVFPGGRKETCCMIAYSHIIIPEYLMAPGI
jgi:hypothetical protein